MANGKEIEIRKIVNILKKRLWIIVVLTTISTAAGMFYTNHTKPTPIYNSSARIIIHDSSGLMDTLLVFIREKPVLEGVVEELGLNYSSSALSGQIQVNRVGSSQIVEISAIHGNSDMATDIANTTATVFMEKAGEVFNFHSVEMLSEAVYQQYPAPINPPSNRMLYAAVIFGIVASIGFIFLLDSLDNTLRSEREVERLLKVPVIGRVSKTSKLTVVKKKERKKNPSIRSEIVDSNN